MNAATALSLTTHAQAGVVRPDMAPALVVQSKKQQLI